MVPLNKEEKDMVDAIGRQDAIKTVKSVCQEVLDQCKSYFDSEIDEEVYSDILEVNAVLKCNKYICKALKELPPVKDSGK